MPAPATRGGGAPCVPAPARQDRGGGKPSEYAERRRGRGAEHVGPRSARDVGSVGGPSAGGKQVAPLIPQRNVSRSLVRAAASARYRDDGGERIRGRRRATCVWGGAGRSIVYGIFPFFLGCSGFFKKSFSVTRAESFIFCSSVVIENEGRSFFSFSRTILSSKKADFQSFKHKFLHL
jgi:hypothetical protein